MRIALATCRELPDPDPDAEPLIGALRALGADAQWVAWDDPAADFKSYDLCVVRSTWDYIHKVQPFLEWTARVSNQTKLLNPMSVICWNSDKFYLSDLEARDVPAVPTIFVPRGSKAVLSALLGGRGWKDIVIKPQVGAGSFATERFGADKMDEAQAFLNLHCAERAMMVQPYLKSVEGPGERALVWIAGELTHAVRKHPRFGADPEQVSTALPISQAERELAERALAPYARELLYARVDLARDDAGRLLLMELELIEPSLFLAQEPRALARLAKACVDAARK